MKSGVAWLLLFVFAAAGFIGYRLTARSFAWVDAPAATQPAKPPKTTPPKPTPSAAPPAIDLNAIKDKIPPALMEQAKNLTPKQLLCLRASISADRLQDALQGRLTSQEMAAVSACLK